MSRPNSKKYSGNEIEIKIELTYAFFNRIPVWGPGRSFLIESLEKRLPNIEVKELEQSIEELQKLLFSWKQKQGRFQPDRANNRKKLFEEIIDLCAEIYPHIVNITCKPFILHSPLRHGDIEIKNLRISVPMKEQIPQI